MLNDLIQKYIEDFNSKVQYAVPNSLPIIWFGDMERYLAAPKKIVTVGMNPSQKEFNVKRFDVSGFQKNPSVDVLTKTLNNYFKYRPYFNYFGGFERVLRIIGASYWEESFTPAVHINIHSALATTKSWSDLPASKRKNLESADLFQSLLDGLKPNIIVSSINQESFHAGFPTLHFDVFADAVGNVKKYQIDKDCILINGKSGVGGVFFGMSDSELEDALNRLL